MKLAKVQQRECDLQNQRAGFAAISTLVEVLLIVVVIWGVVALIPTILQRPAATSMDKSTKQFDPIFRLAKTDNDRIWGQMGNSEIVSVDLRTFETRSVYRRTSRPIKEFHVSRDGQTFLFSLDKREIVIFRNSELLICEPVPDGLTVELALSADGNTGVICFGQTRIRCWNLSASDPICFDYELPEKVDRVVLDPSGETLVVCTTQGRLDLLEAKTGIRLKSLGDLGPVRGCPVYSDDGNWLGLVSGESLTMCDMRSRQVSWKIQTGPINDLQNIAISSNDRLVAVAGNREEIQILDRSNGETLERFPINDAVNKMVFSGDLLYIAAANNNSIRVWSLSTGRELKPIDLK